MTARKGLPPGRLEPRRQVVGGGGRESAAKRAGLSATDGETLFVVGFEPVLVDRRLIRVFRTSGIMPARA